MEIFDGSDQCSQVPVVNANETGSTAIAYTPQSDLVVDLKASANVYQSYSTPEIDVNHAKKRKRGKEIDPPSEAVKRTRLSTFYFNGHQDSRSMSFHTMKQETFPFSN